MKLRSIISRKLQSGAIGVFLCIVLVIVFGFIGLQNITSTSSDLYLSDSKQRIEEARQLAYAGLRHYTQNFGSDASIDNLINNYRGNTDVVGECSFTQALPQTLEPTVQLANPSTPNNTTQDIEIRGIVVPYNCDRAISDNNYRATFEIVASVNCANSSSAGGVDSGCVKRSFVFNREDNDNGTLPYLPIATPPPPPPPPNPNPPPSGPPPGQSNGPAPGGQPSPPAPPPPPSSIGRQEVGF